jgi:mycofactocin precursor
MTIHRTTKRVQQMSIDSTVTAGPEQAIDDAATADVEELLVEEVSIDGMCGVY